MSAARVRGLANQIVHEPQFRQPGRSWWDHFTSWLGRGFDHVVNYLFAHGRATPVGLVVVVIVLALVIFLASRLARRVRRDPGIDLRVAATPRRSAAEWAAEAARHEAAGEWREAVRCRYRALVAELAAKGVVDEIPGRTAREYAGQVRDHLPPAEAAFGEASDLFEAAWYGHHGSTSAEHDRFKDLAEGVLVEAGQS